MRYRIASILLLGFFVAVPANADVAFQFFDPQGNLLTDLQIAAVVMSPSGDARAKLRLPGRADGTYALPVEPGESVHLRIVGGNVTLDAATAVVKIGEVSATPIPVVITPQGIDNDSCTSPQPVAIGSFTTGSTVGATQDGVPLCGTASTAPGVWYSVVGNGTMLTASTCETIGNPPGSANYDTKLSIYCGEPGCNGECSFTCVGGNDDITACNFHSAVSWCATAGNVYRILVHGFANASGNFGLSVSSNGQSCTSNTPCQSPPPFGACCLTSTCPYPQGEVPVQCTQALEGECLAAGGTYHGPCADCVVTVNQIDLVDPTDVPIPSSTPSGVNRTLVVPTSLIVADVNVDIGINHTWVSDLRITITGPTGVSQVLWNHACTFTDNIFATADDEGTEISCPVIGGGPIDGVFFPPTIAGDGPLSIFDGTDAAGTWTLNVADDFSSDLGTLQQWSLHIIEGAPLCDDVPCHARDTGGGADCDEDEGDDEDGDPHAFIESEAGVPAAAPVGMSRVP